MFIFPCVKQFLESWQEKLLKSDHPTELIKIEEGEEHGSDFQEEMDEPDSAEE